jgi:hypothetical protein
MYASILLAGRACAPAPPPPACPVSVDALTSARTPESPPELVEALVRLPVTACDGPDIRLQALHGATGPAFVWVHSADTVVLWTFDGVVVHEPERRSSFVHWPTDVVVDSDAAFVGRSIWEPYLRLRCVPRPGGR